MRRCALEDKTSESMQNKSLTDASTEAKKSLTEAADYEDEGESITVNMPEASSQDCTKKLSEPGVVVGQKGRTQEGNA